MSVLGEAVLLYMMLGISVSLSTGTLDGQLKGLPL